MKQRNSTWKQMTVAGLMLAFSSLAQAGPPLVCHPFDIGRARSLPWGSDSARWNAPLDSYNLARLADDTLALLTPQTPVIVRMETMRRATIYAQRDPLVAKELLLKLHERTINAESHGRPDALALFDFGYLVETYRQASIDYERQPDGSQKRIDKPNPASGFDGYALVEKAIQIRGRDPQMEFAATLIAEYAGPRSATASTQK